ncbi:MAG: HutD family protein [Oscillospiraceae bacterium]|nr:HutD family protein [Oscillospiraceae bacterium]
MIWKLTREDYKTSEWSGGTTTQIAIFPPDALYAERDFLWRVSSAVVELEESDFTALPDYQRLICSLEGEIQLTHNGGGPLALRPLEVHGFSGADATHCRGRCRDFNLMLRRDRARGSMEVLELTGRPLELRRPGALVLYCVEGCLTAAGEELAAGESLLADAPGALTLAGRGKLLCCSVEILNPSNQAFHS